MLILFYNILLCLIGKGEESINLLGHHAMIMKNVNKKKKSYFKKYLAEGLVSANRTDILWWENEIQSGIDIHLVHCPSYYGEVGGLTLYFSF